MGSLFSKPKSKKARSSAAQIVALCDQHGVPVKIQKISDSFVQKGTVVQIKPNITAPATRTELYIATPEIIHDRQQIIRCTWQTAGLTLDQGGVRLSMWKGQSEAVTGYHTLRESDYSFTEAKPFLRGRRMPDLPSTNVSHLRRKHRRQNLRNGVVNLADQVGREEYDPLVVL